MHSFNEDAKNDEFNSYVFKPMLHIPPNHLAFMHLKNLTIIAKPNLIRKNFIGIFISSIALTKTNMKPIQKIISTIKYYHSIKSWPLVQHYLAIFAGYLDINNFLSLSLLAISSSSPPQPQNRLLNPLTSLEK